MTVTAMPDPGRRREPRFSSTRTTATAGHEPRFTVEEFAETETPPVSSLLSTASATAGPVAARARTGAVAWLRRSGARARQFVLSAAGLGAFCVGGFEAHPVVGWALTGISLLLLEHQAKT